MDLCWWTWQSYRRAAVVGFVSSQYQKRVSKLTNLAHVLSDSLVLLKIFSKSSTVQVWLVDGPELQKKMVRVTRKS